MSKTAIFLLAAAITSAPGALFAQSQSPDQQQEGKADTKTAPKATQPQTGNSPSATGQSPDIQQEKNGDSTGSKQSKKGKNNARQGHGTPKPTKDTATSH